MAGAQPLTRLLRTLHVSGEMAQKLWRDKSCDTLGFGAAVPVKLKLVWARKCVAFINFVVFVVNKNTRASAVSTDFTCIIMVHGAGLIVIYLFAQQRGLRACIEMKTLHPVSGPTSAIGD